jgi:hypothetical protein
MFTIMQSRVCWTCESYQIELRTIYVRKITCSRGILISYTVANIQVRSAFTKNYNSRGKHTKAQKLPKLRHVFQREKTFLSLQINPFLLDPKHHVLQSLSHSLVETTSETLKCVGEGISSHQTGITSIICERTINILQLCRGRLGTGSNTTSTSKILCSFRDLVQLTSV